MSASVLTCFFNWAVNLKEPSPKDLMVKVVGGAGGGLLTTTTGAGATTRVPDTLTTGFTASPAVMATSETVTVTLAVATMTRLPGAASVMSAGVDVAPL